MITNDNRSRGVKSVETLFEIVSFLQQHRGATVTEVADHLDLAKSTVHAHLTTMWEYEYVVKEGDQYKLGLKFLNHGIFARNEFGLLDIVRPKLEELADETGEVAWLVVEEHGKVVNLDNAMGEHAVQTVSGIAERLPIYATSAGKAILAHFPEERTEEILGRRQLENHTSRTITDPDDLRDELEDIRSCGVAFADSEFVKGVRAISAPILNQDQVVGAITISGPANRLKGEVYQEEVPDLILGATNEVELKLTYSDTTHNRVGF